MTAAPAFPAALTDSRAFAIARAMLDGFDRHYRLFRQASAEAKKRFEAADWHGQQQAQAQRIAYYERRVAEATERLQSEFEAATLPMEVWQQVKLHYIGLLINHYQPELAETFFNSVTTKILHRSYFHNDFIFVRSAVSTDHLENDEPAALPTYRAYYPTKDTLAETWHRVVTNFQLDREFEDLGRDVADLMAAVDAQLGEFRLRTNFQIQVLSSLFFRNKGAYIVGKIINGFNADAVRAADPARQRTGLVIDAALFGEDDLELVFSFARAYFMVTMEVPSAYVQFLRSLMPRKPRSEIYSALGLQKQGKSLFYRDLLMHMRHSSDKFRIAPGIKGMVMLVFDLPSFPYVFKVIKDFYPPPKDTTRELIKSKYLLVKQHDRVGRMADTLEYSDVAFPRARFDDELVAELRHFCASLVEEEGDMLVIRHCYIERRMIPLNIYLQDASAEQIASVRRSSTATRSRTWCAPTSSPATCCGRTSASPATAGSSSTTTTRSNTSPTAPSARCPRRATRKTRCRARSGTGSARRTSFPRPSRPFLLGNPAVREVFMAHHADLLDAGVLARPQGGNPGRLRA